jgi:hypothetical protein
MRSHQINYSRYFIPKQKVSLINMTEGRNREQFESLSGFVIASKDDTIEIQLLYPLEQDISGIPEKRMSFKITSESLGNGIQVLADLENIVPGNVMKLRLRDNLELFQRRKSPRIDTSMKLMNLRKDLPLFSFRKEWSRIMDYMQANGLPPNFVLQDTPVNLSNSGIRHTTDIQMHPSKLSMFIIDVNDGLLPVCALAEMVWKSAEMNEMICGHRFIHILKTDQERLNRHVQAMRKQLGLPLPASKNNWELLDRMTL